MNCYVISFDIKVGISYNALTNAIKSYGTWARITESTWAVVTSQPSDKVRDHLIGYIEKNDRLFVIKSAREAAWINAMCNNDWLKKNL